MFLKIWKDKFVTALVLRTHGRSEGKPDSFLILVIDGDELLAVYPGRFNPASMEPEGSSALELV